MGRIDDPDGQYKNFPITRGQTAIASSEEDRVPDPRSGTAARSIANSYPSPDRFSVAALTSMPSSQDPYSYLREDDPDSDAPVDETGSENPEVDDPAVDLAFDDEGVGEELRHASGDERNRAPFGIIKIDDAGTVQFYNRYESNLSGIDPDEAVGTNFFTELAPCSNNPLFLGRFKEGVDKGELDEYFTYTFTYKMRPTLVDVRLYRDEAGNNWIMIQKR